MKFFYLLSLSMPLLVQATVSTFSQTLCTTKVASKKPSKVSTKSAAATITLRPTVTSSVTNTKTVTPTSSITVIIPTTTTTTTTTTMTQMTDTFFSTVTSTITSSFSTTLTETDSTTITTATTVTSTISSGASGFTPIASGFASQGYSAGAAKLRRTADALPTTLQARATPTKDSTNKKMYPYEVGCAKLVEIVSTSTVTKTASKAKTVTASSPTTTVTTTITATSTSTLTPTNALTTSTVSTSVTASTTATFSTTITNTYTSVQTSFAPTETVYPGCGPDNVVNTVNGKFIAGTNFPRGSRSATTAVSNSAYDCCVTCLNTADCAGTAFAPTQGNVCYLLKDNGVCSQADSGNFFDIVAGAQDSANSQYMSNGPCGYGFVARA